MAQIDRYRLSILKRELLLWMRVAFELFKILILMKINSVRLGHSVPSMISDILVELMS